ncbi:MAG: DNA-directed RNA polymerase subunit omega [Bacteroidota bacterium]
MPIKPVDMESFYSSAGNIYEAIVVTSKRARQIHDEMKIELNQRLETIKQLTQVTTESEEDLENVGVNPDQLKISLEFEARPKVTDMALDEITSKKFTYRYKEEPETPAA